MATLIEAAVDEIVSLTNQLDAGLDLLIDHARKDQVDEPKHCACEHCLNGAPHMSSAVSA